MNKKGEIVGSEILQIVIWIIFFLIAGGALILLLKYLGVI